jgi:hypothetical protein
LDVLLACVVLAQFQTSTGIEHFEALKHLVGYLRRNPDIPLNYCRTRFDASVSFLDIVINKTDPLRSKIFSSTSYHVGSVDLISRTQELTIASALLFETEEARQGLPGAIRQDELPFLPDKSVVDNDIAEFPESVDDPIYQKVYHAQHRSRKALSMPIYQMESLRKTPSSVSLLKWPKLASFPCAAKQILLQIIQPNPKWVLLIVLEKAYVGHASTWMILDYLSKPPFHRLKTMLLLREL